MKKYGKYTLLGWSWRVLMWIVLTPIFLLLLFSVLIYVPAVQNFAVDKVAEVLSEEMGMEVTVEDVSLKFPLNLSMGGVLAVQNGDTVIDARRLEVSVRALPLLKMQAEVDGIHLYDTKINTKDLIEACVVRGELAELSLDSHSTDLKKELAVVNKALLRDADFMVLLNDSVPEDTMTSEPVMWKVQLDDIELQNVKATVLLSPQSDSTYVMADIATAHANGFLDLGAEIYSIYRLDVANSSAGFDMRNEPHLPNQLDPSHLLFNDVSLTVDSFNYRGTGDMAFDLAHLSGTEQSGLVITEAISRVEMDSLTLRVPKLNVKTLDSEVALVYNMDLNAFDSINPGTFTLASEGWIGKDDIIYFTRMGGEDTRDVCAMMYQELPARPVEMRMKAGGNLHELEVSDLYMKVPGRAVAEGNATLWGVATDSLALQAKIDVRDDYGAQLSLNGAYAMASEMYNADLVFNHLVLNHYVLLADLTRFSGKASVQGRGFDFSSRNATMTATANISDGQMGLINLSGIDADVSLKDNQILLDLACSNEQIQTDFTFDGELTKNLISGQLNIDLPFVNVQSMGFSEDKLQVSTSGTMNFSYNFDKLFTIDSHIEELTLLIGDECLITDDFYLFAEALQDTTAATLRTGDLSFQFFTPNNAFNLLPIWEQLEKETVRQFTKREVDLNALKAYFPELSLHAAAGRNNPVSAVLATYGMSFNEFVADVEASPIDGLTGGGHLYMFKKDSLTVDTSFFKIIQDSTHLDYHLGVRCHEQPQIPAFRAYLDGELMADKVDAHLTYFDKKDKKGIDFGFKALAVDSCINIGLYPEKPIIAYRQFELNKGNFIRMRRDKPILADVRLTSMSDSCYVAFFAHENVAGRQTGSFIVRDLRLSELLSVVPIPGMPKMDGIMGFEANYIDHDENDWIGGTLSANRFTYEDARVGDFGVQFAYTPHGETAHDIDAHLSFNGTDIVMVDGLYDTEGNGSLYAGLSLLDVPMSMLAAFVPDQIVNFSGALAGGVTVSGALDSLRFDGDLVPKDVHVLSNMYSLDLALANDTITLNDSRMDFHSFKFYGADSTPLTLNGYVDFSDFNEIFMSLSLNGQNFKVIEAKRTSKKVLFGDMYGDFFTRVIGSTKDLTVRGLVRVLPTTNITYIMTETPLYQGDRLEDIVTFVDFNAPPPPRDETSKKTFMGVDMNLTLSVEPGARVNCEFSADKQSYVTVQGGGSLAMTYTPEGVFSLMGRYTINEGEMKYTLPVIPLKTFTIHNGSYIEFTGNPANPTFNISATERTKAAVGQSDGTSRSVAFDVGLKITNTLEDMGLEFTIAAPEDMAVQNELASCSAEEKNKLAVAMLATGMYLSGSNSKGFTAGNALNNFLQNEINNIAGQALSTMVEVNVGMEQTTRDDGTKRTDYSFQFSRRFFSDRLNVVIGGKVSADNGNDPADQESGAYIDDISLEWRLDNGGTQYIRVFHEKDFSSLIEGELDKNGAGVLLRKKMDKMSELFIWKKKKEEEHGRVSQTGNNHAAPVSAPKPDASRSKE